MKRTGLFLFSLALAATLGAMQFRIMSYNSLNFNGEDADRAAYFAQIVQSVNPQVLMLQESITQAGVDLLLDAISEVDGDYEAATFVNGYDTDNILFYKPYAVTLVDQGVIETALRDINEYELEIYGQPFYIYSCHLKASTGYEEQRLAEVTLLRNHLNTLPAGSEFAIGGDMNFYTSTEPAYQKFIASESNNNGRSFDPSLAGNWHDNAQFAAVHTQSTRDVSIGDGGSTGGMDDRFDFLFLSYAMNDGEGVEYIEDTYTPYGNDGNHLNDAVNAGTNTAVSEEIADALYYASDHLPIFADFTTVAGDFDVNILAYRIEEYENAPLLSWITRNESDMIGYRVWRCATNNLDDAVQDGDIIEAANSAGEQYYSFHTQAHYGSQYYWLQTVALDGSSVYTNPLYFYSNVSVADVTSMPLQVNLAQNYPNPFNPVTNIAFSMSRDADVDLAVYNVRGQRVATLAQGNMPAGNHSVQWNGADEYGRSVASGVYLCRLTVGNTTQFRKMVLTK